MMRFHIWCPSPPNSKRKKKKKIDIKTTGFVVASGQRMLCSFSGYYGCRGQKSWGADSPTNHPGSFHDHEITLSWLLHLGTRFIRGVTPGRPRAFDWPLDVVDG